MKTYMWPTTFCGLCIVFLYILYQYGFPWWVLFVIFCLPFITILVFFLLLVAVGIIDYIKMGRQIKARKEGKEKK